MSETPDNYLRDLGHLITEVALRAKAERDNASPADRPFREGRLSALHEIIDLMLQQADAFGLSRSAVCLDEVEPDRDLL